MSYRFSRSRDSSSSSFNQNRPDRKRHRTDVENESSSRILSQRQNENDHNRFHRRGFKHPDHKDDSKGYQPRSRPDHKRGGRGGGGGYRRDEESISEDFESLKTGPSRTSYYQSSSFPQSKNYEILTSHNDKSPVRQGEPKDLTGNYFKLDTQNIKVYHYDLLIAIVDQEKKSKDDDDNGGGGGGSDQEKIEDAGIEVDELVRQQKKAQRREKFLRRNSNSILKEFLKLLKIEDLYVYDGWKNVYFTKLIEDPTDSYFREFDYRSGPEHSFPLKIKAVITHVDTIEMRMIQDYFSKKIRDLPKTIVSLINLIFKNVLPDNYTEYQGKYFDLTKRSMENSMLYLETVPGFEISTRMSQIGLALVVNPRVTLIFSQQYEKLSDLVQKFDPSNFPNRINLDKINHFLKHMSIFTIHGERKRSYKIHSIIRATPQDKKFTLNNGTILTVYQYFNGKYGISPEPYPLVRTNNDEYIPLELCYPSPKQFLNKNKHNSEIQSLLLKKSEFRPKQYFECITNFVQQIIDNNHKLLKHFGIKIHNLPARFDGYVLEQPTMLNRNPFYIHEPGDRLDWGIISFDRRIDSRLLRNFVSEMMINANKMNIIFGEHKLTECYTINELSDIKRKFDQIKDMIKFCFAVIPDNHPSISPSEIYAMVSSVASQTYSIRLQCLNASRIRRIPKGYFTNLLFEVNGKLGGQNSVIDPNYIRSKFSQVNLDFNETMIIGVDVNHPGLKEKAPVSIAVASGSFNPTFTKYANSIRVQKRDKTEIVDHIDEMIEELLVSYQNQNHRLPRNLIVFRDGVSEGQFDSVKVHEISSIHKVIDDYHRKNPTTRPMTLTFVIVQKRHQTRFVTTKPYKNPESHVETQNVPSGTVVDNTIVEPNFDIFYVNSHYSRLGTSKPTKYIVCVNELEMPNALLHRLCFYVCFNCVRHRCPMSLPTPVFYADLCAYRSKIHIISNSLMAKEGQNRRQQRQQQQEQGRRQSSIQRTSSDQSYVEEMDLDRDRSRGGRGGGGGGAGTGGDGGSLDDESYLKRLQMWAQINDLEYKDTFFYT